jgi:O-antigen ligase
VTVIGGIVALVGIVQKPLFAGQIYGFWTPQQIGNPFGPFVNKNHFAGWMLMCIPLTLGLICAGLTRATRGGRRGLRQRVLWFSSDNANQILLLAGAATVMALSLTLTMSRSGMAALAVSVLITSWIVARSGDTGTSRATALMWLAGPAVVVVAWVGIDVIVTRFADADWRALNGRRDAWTDAWSIARQFPLFGTGLNTYGVATLFYQKHDLAVHYAQAHNDYLQLAVEGGLLLTVPAVACIATFVRDVRRRFREDACCSAYWIRAGAVTSLVAIALQESVEFSLQMPGNAALFAVICGVALHKTPRSRLA